MYKKKDGIVLFICMFFRMFIWVPVELPVHMNETVQHSHNVSEVFFSYCLQQATLVVVKSFLKPIRMHNATDLGQFCFLQRSPYSQDVNIRSFDYNSCNSILLLLR